MASQTLSQPTMEALSKVLTRMIDEFGSEWETAKRLDVSQSTINRAIHKKSAGKMLLLAVLAHLKMNEAEFVAKYAPEAEMKATLGISPKVRRVCQGKNWLPTTVQQLEVAHRNYPAADEDELADLGVQYEASNRRLARIAARGG